MLVPTNEVNIIAIRYKVNYQSFIKYLLFTIKKHSQNKLFHVAYHEGQEITINVNSVQKDSTLGNYIFALLLRVWKCIGNVNEPKK